MSTHTPILLAEHLTYTYPFQKKPALHDISFSLKRGEALLITGPSGCGKSTLLRILNGLIPEHFKGTLEGRLVLNGDEGPLPMATVSRTVGTVLQNPDEQFMATTVQEEVAIALEWQCIEREDMCERVGRALRVLDLTRLAERSVFNLSSGEKQKCVLAATLAAKADIIVMDEPTANLSPEATEDLAKLCLELKKQGVTLIIVDHRLYWLRGVLDHLIVLNRGRAVFTQSKLNETDLLDMLETNGSLRSWGLRRVSVHRPELEEVGTHGDGVISVTDMTFRHSKKSPYLFKHFNLTLPRAAVTVVVGANGAGKTTLARLLCGLSRPESGTIRYNGHSLRRKERREKAAFVMQQTEVQLYMRTVMEELLTSAPRGMPRAERETQARRWLKRFRLSPLADRHPQSLSGGEKQRLVIACALMKQPELLILDEPTSGLDGRNMGVIAEELEHFVHNGGTALTITHDLELLERIAAYRLTISPERTGLTEEDIHNERNAQ